MDVVLMALYMQFVNLDFKNALHLFVVTSQNVSVYRYQQSPFRYSRCQLLDSLFYY